MRITSVLCFVLFASPAMAADFSKPLLDADGKNICIAQVDPCPDDKIATLGKIVRAALYASFPDEQNLSLDEKLRRGDLAQQITGVSEIKIKAEDIALMKKVVGKAYGPLVVWSAVRELDPH